MSLHQTILTDMTSAMKQKEMEKLATLRLIKAALLNAVKEKNVTDLPDDAVLAILNKEAKNRKESIKAFEAGDRKDLAAKEQAELEIIEEYLPEQMSEAEVRTKVEAAIAKSDAKEFGAVMGAAMKELKGQADGAVVKKIVQELLS